MASSDQAPASGGRSVSLRDRRRIRTKQLVQSEALRLFAEKGYRNTTIDEIAHAAAMSPRTFFRYFPGKEDVLFWDEYDDPPLSEEIWQRPFTGDPIVQSIAIIRDMICTVHQADPERLLARLKICFAYPEVWGTYVSRQSTAAAALFGGIAKYWGVSAEDLGMRVLASAIYAAVTVAVERWQHNDGRDDIGELFDEAIVALVDGAQRLRPAVAAPPGVA